MAAQGPIVGGGKITPAGNIGNPPCKSTPIVVARPITSKSK